jgi:tetratricopeptide (TPR) repeat protein
MLVPMLGFVQVGIQPHADRYLYLPQIGLSIALVFFASGELLARPGLRAPVAIATGLALAALALTAARQVETFRDAIALQSHAVAVTDGRRLQEAERELTRALALAPWHVKIRIALADVLAQRGRIPEAIRQYRQVPAADPSARALLLAALRASAADRDAAGQTDQAASLRALQAELRARAPRAKGS